LLLGTRHQNIEEKAVKWLMIERENGNGIFLEFQNLIIGVWLFMTVLGLINFIAYVDTKINPK